MFPRFVQSSWRRVRHLRHRLSEDVSERKDRLHPFAFEPDAEIHPRLCRSVRVGEKNVFHFKRFSCGGNRLDCHEDNFFFFCFFCLALQREAKLQLLTEAIAAYSALTDQVNNQ